MVKGPLYRDKTWLRQKYLDDGLTQDEIAEFCDCSQTTIYTWLKKHGIPTRGHAGYMDEPPWRDEQILRELHDKYGEAKTIAGHFGVSKSVISRWMSRYGIETNNTKFKKKATPKFSNRYEHGYVYEGWPVAEEGRSHFIRHHRLLATLLVDDISELKGKDVHHKNEIPWDNRLENLQLVTLAEHTKIHRMWENRHS